MRFQPVSRAVRARAFTLALLLSAFVALASGGIAAASTPPCNDYWITSGSGAWSDPSNWSAGVPTSSSDVCITQAGNYTVTLDGVAAIDSLTLGLPSNVGTQELDVVAPTGAYADLLLSNDSAVAATGTLVLDSPAGAGFSDLGGTGVTVTDSGLIQSQVEGTSTNDIAPSIAVMGTGALVAFSGETDAEGTLTNQGDLSVGGGATLYVDGGSVDNAGGAVYNSGTLKLYSGTWSQDGGSESGNPVTLFDCSFLGNAPGSTGDFDITGGVTVTGAITADETLTVLGLPGLSASANLQYDVVNDGTIVLDTPDATDSAQLYDSGDPANQLTNDGTLDATASGGGAAVLQSTVQNNNLIEVEAGELMQVGPSTTNDGELTVDPGAIYEVGGGSFNEQSDGTLTFGITGPSSFGQIQIEPGLTFNLNGGAAAVNLAGYSPPAGTEFDVITGPYGSGQFATVPSGFVADYSHPGYIGLTVAPAIVNTASPAISGTLQDGKTLTTTNGTWQAPSALKYAYHWQLCDATGANCAPIATGATGRTFRLSSADVGHYIGVIVTATDTQGQQASASAQPVGAVLAPAPPANTALPRITGTLRDGSIVAATTGTWTSPDALHYSYSWELCTPSGQNCQPAGVSTSTFKLTSADVGDEIAVMVTATDQEGQPGQATAGPAGPVAAPPPPHDVLLPLISGRFAAGQTLKTTNGLWSSPDHLSYGYQWEDCDGSGQNCTAISGATAQSYKLATADLAGTVTVVVTATDQESQPGQATAKPYS